MGFDYQRKRQFLAEINLTPLVDVVFVLLIIFMVTAPLMTQGVEVDLPKTRTVKQLPQSSNHVILSIAKDGKLMLDKYKIAEDKLEEQLKKLRPEQKKIIYLRADQGTPYGTVVRIMGEIKAAGIDKIGVVADESKRKKK